MNKKRISVLCIILLLFVQVGSVYATTIQEAEDELNELKEQEEKAEAERDNIATQLKELTAEMDDIFTQLGDTYDILEELEIELAVNQAVADDQYQSMKQRIRFMYEQGESSYLEILFGASSLKDLLNKVDYIQQITDYDREKLEEYQAIIEEIEEQKELMEEERVRLEELQASLSTKKTEVEQLLASANNKLEDLESEIGESSELLQQLIANAKALEDKENEAQGGQGGTAGDDVASGSGYFTHPMPGYTRISSHFGYRDAPLAGASTNHKGTDFAAPTGTPVYAAAAGTVTGSTYHSAAGNMVTINHGDGMVTMYLHLHQKYVSVGDKVSRGQNIGTCGTTGNSTGPHLHFQVMKNGTAVDSMNYL